MLVTKNNVINKADIVPILKDLMFLQRSYTHTHFYKKITTLENSYEVSKHEIENK